MKISLDHYKIISKIFLGTGLRIAFQHTGGTADRKVLELNEVAGFIDRTGGGKPIKIVRIDDGGGSYSYDLSLRLQSPAIAGFPEVFVFADKDCTNIVFRSVAKTIVFRDWTENDKWLP